MLKGILNAELQKIDFTSIAGKSAGDFQDSLFTNEVDSENRQIENFSDALGGIDLGDTAGLLSKLVKPTGNIYLIVFSINVESLQEILGDGVDLGLDFTNLDVNNEVQLNQFAQAIQDQNLDLSNIAANFDPR